MTGHGRLAAAAAVTMALAGVMAWRGLPWGDEREIRSVLASVASDFNAATSEGPGALARAAQLGSYFSDDVVVDLGPGSAPIAGRDRLIGMAARLEPRTAAYRVVLDDINVNVKGSSADVTLTVSFVRRAPATDEETTDAREFALQMVKRDRWRIARATGIDTFRK